MIAADVFHMLRRFLAGFNANENSHEREMFDVFRELVSEPGGIELLRCTLKNFERLPDDIRDRLFDSRFLGDINEENDFIKIRDAFAGEVLHYLLENSDPGLCGGIPRPG